jgi:uncharacterized protein YgbK (DUF1537 family)
VKTVVLDDDPTGTQSASGVRVLLQADAAALADALLEQDAVYVVTNTRAMERAAAVELCRELRDAGNDIARRRGERVRFVLRGDSTLRGHTFAEADVFAAEEAVVLFVPAFPAGGRTTLHGVHLVQVGGRQVPVGETEFARDPVFGFSSSALTEYVAEVGDGRAAVSVPLAEVRAGTGAVASALLAAAPGTVVCPDVVTEDDVAAVHRDLLAAEQRGRTVVVRSAAPLAARCAGVLSDGLLPVPLVVPPGPVLVVCGSHTAAASAQLRTLEPRSGPPVQLSTTTAQHDPAAAAAELVPLVRARLQEKGVAVVATERRRSADHGTLGHGERVMAGLTAAVAGVADAAAVVVAKGGITSAEVARTGLGSRSAVVRGQVLAGVSVWDLERGARGSMPYVVVPGNVGDERTLVDVLAAVRPGTG